MGVGELSCVICGHELPKYRLDRYTNTLCGTHCEGREIGRREGVEILMGIVGMFEAIRGREELADDPSCDMPCPECGAPEGKACRKGCAFDG